MTRRRLLEMQENVAGAVVFSFFQHSLDFQSCWKHSLRVLPVKQCNLDSWSHVGRQPWFPGGKSSV